MLSDKSGKDEITPPTTPSATLAKAANINTETPRVSKLWDFYKQGNIQVNEDIRTEFVTLLEELKKIEEIHHQQEKQQHSHQQQLIKHIEASNYYQSAKEIIKDMVFNKAYVVDIVFNDEGNLESSKLEIRKSGTQGRHTTPIALIKRIINHALQPGYTAAEILNAF